MLLLGLGWVATSLVHATAPAPITAVTVYSDQARVVRTATLEVSGVQRVELPRLPDFVDPESIRVEAQGAEVSAVEVRPASAPPFPRREARELLDTLDRLDDAIARVDTERAAHEVQLAALRRVQPAVPQDGDDASTTAPTAPLAPATWGPSASFLVDSAAKLEARIRALTEQAATLKADRSRRLEEAGQLGALSAKPGIEVAVTLAGTGQQAKVQLSYLVPGRVRWYPRYELQLQPEQQRVQVALSGRVSQETGEDWEGAKLTLSTALPSTATALPRLATWKLGPLERFIPQPRAREESPSEPPPLQPREPEPDLEAELRKQLLARAGKPAPSEPTPEPPAPPETRAEQTSGRSTLVGTLIDAASRQAVPDVVVTATSPQLQGERVVVTDAQGHYRIPDLPPGVYTLRFEKEEFRPYHRSDIQLRPNRIIRVNVELLPEQLGAVVEISGGPSIEVGSTATGVDLSRDFQARVHRARTEPPEPVIDSYMGLAPPPGWQPPRLASDLPASLAGGHDLAFTAPRAETVRSGQGERTIPLLVESWTVQVERHVFPALAPDAHLVAQLESPSRGVLPGGQAALFVGADPAGSATLDLVVPGEPFTLPLGVDRSVRPARNVRLVQSREGLISKDDVNTYEVTLEVPNPYPFPLRVRVVDQWPLSQDGQVEVKLVRTTPAAQPDEKTGELRWDLVVPPSSKQTVSFEYSLRRPKDWRLSQSP
jgi:hypothetical protein